MRRFDLNLLYTLRELLKEPNTTKVGEKLGLTQSAVSSSLNRLRWAFQDDLLVRSGRAMAPTKRAEKLLEPVDEILGLIEKLVEEVRFEPKNLNRTFRIASGEYVLLWLMPSLLARLRREAPGISIRCDTSVVENRSLMRSGHIDLALLPSAVVKNNDNLISHKFLYTDRLVCITSRSNEEIGERITQEEYLKARHVVVSPDSSKNSEIYTAAEKFAKDRQLNIDIVCEISSYAVLPGALSQNDMVATIPSRIFHMIPNQDAFRVFDLPFEAPEFDVSMVWNTSFDKDPEHQWFRNMVEDIYRE